MRKRPYSRLSRHLHVLPRPDRVANQDDSSTAEAAPSEGDVPDPLAAIASMLKEEAECTAQRLPGVRPALSMQGPLPHADSIRAALRAVTQGRVQEEPLPAAVQSPYFLQQLQAIREGDSASGRTWRSVQGVTARQALALGHIDRSQFALATIGALLHASQQCIRRQPEDFGIGDDRHEGLIHAIRELVDAQRLHIDALEIRGRESTRAGC